jgi:ubiquinone/menaquinone biosynthesis C-methylase UbiE
MAPTQRFSDRVDDYVRFRPSYPAPALDAILEGLDAASIVVADIGSGTGIMSRLLAARLSGTSRLIALEPNADMADAHRLGAPDARVEHVRTEHVAATGEATGLPDASVHLIVCAQAFHWMRHEDALREFSRVLVPGGRVAIVWNLRDDADPFTRHYGSLLRQASGDHPAERAFTEHEHLRLSERFRAYREIVVPSSQALDAPSLLGRARSASYCPKDGPAWEQLRAELLAAHARHADGQGLVRLAYRTSVHLAERV